MEVLLLLLASALHVRSRHRIIVPRVVEHRLVTGWRLVLGALRIEICLRRYRLQPAGVLQILPFELLILLLLLQLGSHQRAVVEVAAAAQIDSEQVEVRAHGRWRTVGRERLAASR